MKKLQNLMKKVPKNYFLKPKLIFFLINLHFNLAGDGVLVALLIFFIMIISLVTTGGLIYLSKEFIEGIKIVS